MTSIRRLLAVAAVVAFGASLPADGAPAPAPVLQFDRDVVECIEETPAAIEPVDTEPDTPTVVNVMVLHDGVPLDKAKAALRRTAAPYERLGLKFATTYKKASFRSDGKYAGKETGGGQRLIDDAKKLFKGARPKGFDVVYVLTGKDIYSGSSSSPSYGLAGLADCIGGVRYPDRAFAVGEFAETFVFAGLKLPPEFTAAVAAHEVGHLLGAHHHYSTCSRPTPPVAGGADVCTVMFPDIEFAGLEFSVVNGSVVRGHANEYARP